MPAVFKNHSSNTLGASSGESDQEDQSSGSRSRPNTHSSTSRDSFRTNVTTSSARHRAAIESEKLLYNVDSRARDVDDRKPDSVMEERMNKKIHQMLMEGVKQAPVMIADTVVYKNGYPAAWFFTSVVDACIKKKKTQNMNLPAMIQAFSSGADDPSTIVAYFVSTTWDANHVSTNHVTFLDVRQLQAFILSENPMREGFLQKWVKAREGKHDMASATDEATLHCSWTPHRCMVETRKCFFLAGATEKATRAMGQTSERVNIEQAKTEVSRLSEGNKLHCRIEAQCQQIVDHIMAVTKEHLPVHSLSCYFKIGRGNRLYFLWASAINVRDGKDAGRYRHSLSTTCGRASPALKVARFLGSDKESLDDKVDVVGHRPPTGTPCKLCLAKGPQAASYAITYAMIMEVIQEERDKEKQPHDSEPGEEGAEEEPRPMSPRTKAQALEELLGRAAGKSAAEQVAVLEEGLREAQELEALGGLVSKPASAPRVSFLEQLGDANDTFGSGVAQAAPAQSSAGSSRVPSIKGRSPPGSAGEAGGSIGAGSAPRTAGEATAGTPRGGRRRSGSEIVTDIHRVVFQIKHQDELPTIVPEESPLQKLHVLCRKLFENMDVSSSGKLGRIELENGLLDYGYNNLELDLIFHLMDKDDNSRITYSEFYKGLWMLSEHVMGLQELLEPVYGRVVDESPLRMRMEWMGARVVMLQRLWRSFRQRRSTELRAEQEMVVLRKSGSGAVHASNASFSMQALYTLQRQAEEKKRREERNQAKERLFAQKDQQQARRGLLGKRAAHHLKQRVAEAWPKSLDFLQKRLPHKDVRLLARRAHDPNADYIFAVKKIWCCEACARRFNKAAAPVFVQHDKLALETVRAEVMARLANARTLSTAPIPVFPPVAQPTLPAPGSSSTSRRRRRASGSAVLDAPDQSTLAPQGSQLSQQTSQAVASERSYPIAEVPKDCTVRTYRALAEFTQRLCLRNDPHPPADPATRPNWRPAGRSFFPPAPPPRIQHSTSATLDGTQGSHISTLREFSLPRLPLQLSHSLPLGDPIPRVASSDRPGWITERRADARDRDGKRVPGGPGQGLLKDEAYWAKLGVDLTPRARWFLPVAPAEHGSEGRGQQRPHGVKKVKREESEGAEEVQERGTEQEQLDRGQAELDGEQDGSVENAAAGEEVAEQEGRGDAGEGGDGAGAEGGTKEEEGEGDDAVEGETEGGQSRGRTAGTGDEYGDEEFEGEGEENAEAARVESAAKEGDAGQQGDGDEGAGAEGGGEAEEEARRGGEEGEGGEGGEGGGAGSAEPASRDVGRAPSVGSFKFKFGKAPGSSRAGGTPAAADGAGKGDAEAGEGGSDAVEEGAAEGGSGADPLASARGARSGSEQEEAGGSAVAVQEEAPGEPGGRKDEEVQRGGEEGGGREAASEAEEGREVAGQGVEGEEQAQGGEEGGEAEGASRASSSRPPTPPLLPLDQLRKALEAAFEDVYGAYAYFDPEGEWRVSTAALRKGAVRLGLKPRVAEQALQALLQELLVPDGEGELLPRDFVRSLAWHDIGIVGQHQPAKPDAAASPRGGDGGGKPQWRESDSVPQGSFVAGAVHVSPLASPRRRRPWASGEGGDGEGADKSRQAVQLVRAYGPLVPTRLLREASRRRFAKAKLHSKAVGKKSPRKSIEEAEASEEDGDGGSGEERQVSWAKPPKTEAETAKTGAETAKAEAETAKMDREAVKSKRDAARATGVEHEEAPGARAENAEPAPTDAVGGQASAEADTAAHTEAIDGSITASALVTCLMLQGVDDADVMPGDREQGILSIVRSDTMQAEVRIWAERSEVRSWGAEPRSSAMQDAIRVLLAPSPTEHAGEEAPASMDAAGNGEGAEDEAASAAQEQEGEPAAVGAAPGDTADEQATGAEGGEASKEETPPENAAHVEAIDGSITASALASALKLKGVNDAEEGEGDAEGIVGSVRSESLQAEVRIFAERSEVRSWGAEPRSSTMQDAIRELLLPKPKPQSSFKFAMGRSASGGAGGAQRTPSTGGSFKFKFGAGPGTGSSRSLGAARTASGGAPVSESAGGEEVQPATASGKPDSHSSDQVEQPEPKPKPDDEQDAAASGAKSAGEAADGDSDKGAALGRASSVRFKLDPDDSEEGKHGADAAGAKPSLPKTPPLNRQGSGGSGPIRFGRVIP